MIIFDGMEIFMLILLGVIVGVIAVILLIMAFVFLIQKHYEKKLSKEWEELEWQEKEDH